MTEQTRLYDLFVKHGFGTEASTFFRSIPSRDQSNKLSLTEEKEYPIARQIALFDNPHTAKQLYDKAERDLREYFILGLQRPNTEEAHERLANLNGEFITLVGRKAA
tara:strand:+ start:156 stop:476 length:321 start_codon:yes stop_codon:yes gene_type:complete